MAEAALLPPDASEPPLAALLALWGLALAALPPVAALRLARRLVPTGRRSPAAGARA